MVIINTSKCIDQTQMAARLDNALTVASARIDGSPQLIWFPSGIFPYCCVFISLAGRAVFTIPSRLLCSANMEGRDEETGYGYVVLICLLQTH